MLERYGDTLYRIASLFAASPAQAHELLLRFARSYTTALVPSDDQQLLEALLPLMQEIPDRRQANAQHAMRPMLDTLPAADARLLTAILKLPRAQRAALAMLALQLPFEETMQLDEHPLSELRRDALLGLAELMNRPTLAAAMTDAEANELCQVTRAALILEDPGQHHTAAVRGHLALCTDCRSLSQSWQGLMGQVSDMLRSVLRTVHMPEEFGERMLVAAQPVPSRDMRSMLRNPWLLRMALPVFVLGLIAILVFWRPPEEPASPTASGAGAVNLIALITSAQGNLYSAQSEVVQLQSYEMRWPFSDGSYAPLVGQIWRDPARNQLRAQLTHDSGGAPYEFLLTGRGTAWYAITSLYGDSVYPLLLEPRHTRIQLRLNEQELRDLSEATLVRGAWAIPKLYLEQARTAKLQSWGRQRIEDGTLVEVIGYRSDRAFSLPSTAQPIDDLQVTVLLLIDPAKGQLRELREVFGPPGGDQVSRTLWRFVSTEELTEAQQIARTFNVAFAWNGTGSFDEQQTGFVHAALPLVRKERLETFNSAGDFSSLNFDNNVTIGFHMPTLVPDKTNVAFLISNNAQNISDVSLVYLGKEREFVFRNMIDTPENQALFSTDQSVETVSTGAYTALLRQVPNGYTAMIRLPVKNSFLPSLMLTYAQGYTRDQVLAILASLAAPTSDTLKQQIELFGSRNLSDDMRELLLAALRQDHSIPADQVRRIRSMVYTRQMLAPDLLLDPYHRRPYNVPANLITTDWFYPAAAGASIAAQYQERRGANDVLYNSSYTDHDGTGMDSYSYGTRPGPITHLVPAHAQDSVLFRALMCGNGQVQEDSKGSKIITLTEQNVTAQSCLWPDYLNIMTYQLETRGNDRFWEGIPYLADLGGSKLTLTLSIDEQNVLRKAETHGFLGVPIMLESWELLEDLLIPVAEAPTATQRQALMGQEFDTAPETFLLQQVTMTDTLKIAGGRMFVPEQAEQAQYFVAVSQPLVGTNFQMATDSVFELALWHGVATQMVLPVQEADGQRRDYIIYQGAAQPLREFLQRHATWQSSAPNFGMPIAGQSRDGWTVFTQQANDFSAGNVFTIVEIEDIMIIFPMPDTLEQQAALTDLRVMGR